MKVREACAARFEAHKGDCSGFARAVAGDMGVPLAGTANEIADTLRAGGGWQVLADGAVANARAEAGDFVLGGLRGDAQAVLAAHGHVVVVVGGQPLARGRYPAAWWGSLGGTPAQDQTVNFAWTAADRDRVAYAAWTGPAGGAS